MTLKMKTVAGMVKAAADEAEEIAKRDDLTDREKWELFFGLPAGSLVSAPDKNESETE